jgi:hypothetical protein
MPATASPPAPVCYPQTPAESAVGVTPSNYSYPELYIERYGGGLSPISNDGAMASALKVAGSTGRGGGTLYFLGSGTYSFADSYSLPAGLIIQGAGYETIMKYTGTGTFLSVSGTAGRVEIRDILIQGPATATAPSTSAGIGVAIGGSTGSAGIVSMRRVQITLFTTGLQIQGLNWGRFELCEFGNATGSTASAPAYTNYTGVNFDALSTISEVTFDSCIVSNNASAGVSTSTPTTTMVNIRWVGCTVQDNGQFITSSQPPQFYMGTVYGFSIDNLYMEFANGTTNIPEAIRSDYLSGGMIRNFTISTCTYGIHDHTGGTMNQVDILNGEISSVSSGGYALYAASEIDVVARNLNLSSYAVLLTGAGCNYLPTHSGLASWPATTDTFPTSPTLSATTGTPTYNTTQTGGAYSKTGNIVNFNLSVVTSGLGMLTGPIQINNLPFALENNHTMSAIFPVECIGITPSGSNNQFYGKLAAGSTAITIWGGGTASPAQIQASALATITTINITGSYQTDS